MGIVIALFALIVVDGTGQAGHEYQTVPTMPPPTIIPTKTPPQTSMYTPRSSATESQVSPTRVQATANPPTQTMIFIASETAMLQTNTPTSLPTRGTTPSISPPAGSATVIATGIIKIATGVISPSPIPEQVPVNDESNTGMYGLVGGGIVVFVVILISLLWWLNRKNADR